MGNALLSTLNGTDLVLAWLEHNSQSLALKVEAM